MKPVRKIKPNNRSITGKYSSAKNKKSQPFESALERDYLTLLEFDDSVESYRVQPVTIHYLKNGMLSRYTPDAAVYYKAEYKRKPLLVEIKYERELEEKEELYASRFAAADEYAKFNGFHFVVITEKDIRTEYLDNLKFLSRFRNRAVETGYAQIILNRLGSKDVITPMELLSYNPTDESSKLIYTLWQLLALNVLSFEKNKRITMTSNIWKEDSNT